jgi:hypothetical protein
VQFVLARQSFPPRSDQGFVEFKQWWMDHGEGQYPINMPTVEAKVQLMKNQFQASNEQVLVFVRSASTHADKFSWRQGMLMKSFPEQYKEELRSVINYIRPIVKEEKLDQARTERLNVIKAREDLEKRKAQVLLEQKEFDEFQKDRRKAWERKMMAQEAKEARKARGQREAEEQRLASEQQTALLKAELLREVEAIEDSRRRGASDCPPTAGNSWIGSGWEEVAVPIPGVIRGLSDLLVGALSG